MYQDSFLRWRTAGWTLDRPKPCIPRVLSASVEPGLRTQTQPACGRLTNEQDPASCRPPPQRSGGGGGSTRWAYWIIWDLGRWPRTDQSQKRVLMTILQTAC